MSFFIFSSLQNWVSGGILPKAASSSEFLFHWSRHAGAKLLRNSPGSY